ncbi:4-coumarate--CoA ligase-like 7 isoform X2 [Agrilus planipennis]|uniref:4-coumarate--CoA ligase-like 7 isoform X2 n=1 Tax=Agrilus planipennis TaxID=224129 RepID=A0A1W4X955_AGRPL|nr:4-coumarate--CoA ligase-like 7 isoform X2 [Agrilus planipennis]
MEYECEEQEEEIVFKEECLNGPLALKVDSSTGKVETCGSIRERAIKIATELKHMNVTPEDIIMVCVRLHPEQATILLSIFLLGAIVAPIDPEMTLTEMKETLIKLRPKVIFCDLRNAAHIERSLMEAKLYKQVHVIHIGGDPTSKKSLDSVLVKEPDISFQPTIIQDSKKKICLIIATQGTTGSPKLVCHSDYALTYQIYLHRQIILETTSRLLSFFPLNWILQVVLCCLCYITSIVKVLPSSYSERAIVRLIHDYRIDTLIISTKDCLKIVKHDSVNDFNLDCLKNIFIGGDISTPLEIVNIHRKINGARLIQFFALTEMCGTVASFVSESFDFMSPASTGKLMPGFKIKIGDLNTRVSQPPNTWGELTITGPSAMLKYFKGNIPSSIYMEKGYFRTGDLAEYDSQGHLYVLGKVTDLKETESTKFCLLEIEEILMDHPLVSEVAVIADNKDIIACVVKVEYSNLTVKSLEEFIEQNLAPQMRPTKIKILSEFPKTNIGKTRKIILEQNYLKVPIQRSIGNLSV